MADFKNRVPEVRDSVTPYIADPELTSFTQNIVTLESLLFRIETEIFLSNPNIGRVGIFISEMQSLKPELDAQQKRVVAKHGGGDENVQRLQSLLAGRLTPIVARADEIVAQAHDRLAAFQRGELPPPSQVPPPRPPVDNPDTSGDDGGMEARISALEKDVAAVKTDVAVIRSNYVTKEDLHRELHGMTWRIFGFASLLAGVVFYIAKFVH
jgi:hypothetical protein